MKILLVLCVYTLVSVCTVFGAVYREQVTGMNFIYIPGKCYKMGNNSGDLDETPEHTVCLDDFYMGETEVTQRQWVALMSENPSYNRDGGDFPVEKVNIEDINVYIGKLNAQTGLIFRLPTEAEWEFVCKAGDLNTVYGTVSGELKRKDANYGRDKCCGADESDGFWHTSPVKTYAPNALGIYDMSGNVYEWLSDAYHPTAYSDHSKNNPLHIGNSGKYVIRGGSWNSGAHFQTCTNRSYSLKNHKKDIIGFRLVLTDLN